MDATKNPAYLRDLAAKVTDFRDELTALLELCVFTSPFIGAGLLPPVTVREDVSDGDWVAASIDEVDHLTTDQRLKVAEVAALLSIAQELSAIRHEGINPEFSTH